MKSSFYILFCMILLPGSLLFSQVSVNTTGDPPDGSAMLEVSSTTKGLLPPRMSSAEMNAIPNPASGLIIFNLDFSKPVFFNGVIWSSFDGQYSCGLPFIDSRDGNNYNTIQIGAQCWMAENLNVGTRIDGATAQSDNETIEKYCYNDLHANCNTYGGLYQWNEMMQYTTTPGMQGICPDGWHLPTDAEWTALTDYVSSESGFWCGGNSGYIAKALAAKTNWQSSTNFCVVGNDLNANNETGFSGLPGGYRDVNGLFSSVGEYGFWWTSTGYDLFNAWYRFLIFDYPLVYRNYYFKELGLSVRCLKDN